MRHSSLLFAFLLFAACERAGKPTDDSDSGPVEMVATPTTSGWKLYFPLPRGVTKPEYRLGNEPQPRPLVGNIAAVPMSREPITIHVSWVGADGQPRGPFAHTLDPRAALAESAMRDLQQRQFEWVELRDLGGPDKLLYLTTLIGQRCGIEKAVYGVDTMEPALPIELGECNVMDPYSIEYEAVTFVQLPSDAKFVSIQLTYSDGTTSPVQSFDSFKKY